MWRSSFPQVQCVGSAGGSRIALRMLDRISFPKLQSFVLPVLPTIGIVPAHGCAIPRHDHRDQLGCVKLPWSRHENAASLVQQLLIRGRHESLPRVHRTALYDDVELTSSPAPPESRTASHGGSGIGNRARAASHRIPKFGGALRVGCEQTFTASKCFGVI